MAEIIYSTDLGANHEALSGAACCFGVFDGVHRGHRFLIHKTVEDAQALGTKATVITFDIDPDELFRADSLKKLMTNEARLGMLASFDVDYVIALPFTHAFAAQEPGAFLESCFCCGGTPASLHVGSDFHFGAKNHGNVDTLRAWGSANGMRVEAHVLKECLGETITATRIRRLLESGEGLSTANELLGRPFRLSGIVETGRQQGRNMGFRTANVHVEPNLRALGAGVYAAYGTIGGKRYKAAVSIGIPPTFAGETEAYCEAHLLNFDEDIYGDNVALDFVEWLRPMRKFDDIDLLIKTVMGDIDWVRTNL